MYSNDVSDVTLPVFTDMRITYRKLNEYKQWLKEKSIKFSLVYYPPWQIAPRAIRLCNEDALIFRLTFGL